MNEKIDKIEVGAPHILFIRKLIRFINDARSKGLSPILIHR